MKKWMPLFLMGSFAVAAPVPREIPRLEQLFGKPETEFEHCRYVLKDKTLVMELSRKLNSHCAGAMKNSPRTRKHVTGNFVATVSVWCDLPEVGGSHFGGGLAVWADEARYAKIDLIVWPKEGIWITEYATYLRKEAGKITESHGDCDRGDFRHKPTELRITRKDNVIDTAYSKDSGKTWIKIGTIEVDWPAKLNIGVIGYNISCEDVVTRFDSLVIQQ